VVLCTLSAGSPTTRLCGRMASWSPHPRHLCGRRFSKTPFETVIGRKLCTEATIPLNFFTFRTEHTNQIFGVRF
jgi:hypothetical protein